MKLLTFILLFGLLAVFLVHNFDSIGQDIGRHLKTGEIIWETKSVPTTNLFSFTEPDFPFTNHHWLSEVIFYGVYNLGGFTGLILLKIFVVLATFILLLLTIKPLWIIDLRSRLSTGVRVGFWPIIVSFVLSIFIFISRTEVRPEIFSFLILAFFLSALFKAKYELTTSEVRGTPDVKTPSWLWFLPLAQLLWVNLHIYFFIGPILFLAFFIDRLFDPIIRNTKYVIQKLLLVGGLIGLATLINPAGIQGALLPFNILKEYGYSIVENQTLAFLADLFGFNLSIFIFKISTAVLVVSFLLTVKKTKERIFEILISTFFIYAGFRMLRNLPLYALASFPVMVILLTDVFSAFQKPGFWRQAEARLQWAAKMLLVVFLVFMIFFVASGGYYKWARLSKTFGFSVPDGLERAASFVKKNNIEGPMFNNFDIGGYLIWKLPEEKVFVDNRPEAYSVEFFSEIYKPMQENREKWEEFSNKYGINFIFFGHTDATPWGQAFLKSIIRNSDWKVVFINENAIILVKNNDKNRPVFSKYKYELAE
ncbi:MAG: hypothetical protein A2655_02130 [Candidatus Yanofskybacteria bacterium RIFCSPHIGHO2_01_FULL_43_42]|uniref:Glycosyltransferase RgtA/B/C/D-like domain-containing protein n=1 Tax=Candidatus Yanofskybacteria bacterium RIFCSPLOWO2_01_FULL_43_22 TaxID=1802695 RepID=A0A1F8GH95_9BACT|nr:MAG: hypothetical protein A2655_02130 [Candidatus Yanofskybacteria bacterium RIFCSPHIGHO2_01_FULL_43_42]OGN13267.1 MAG: hypothetical protein A3D48_03035 [Candidatus Yanofskybacteria bacterium RIFCSPHIGHO2_02_FULL_43_17]OGN24683.1 MAG: hypothetical protein A3A13_01260 [Candidatus Yanofskybacteria bacterium RIFCSPLOWO2_01_FULL_43_22]